MFMSCTERCLVWASVLLPQSHGPGLRREQVCVWYLTAEVGGSVYRRVYQCLFFKYALLKDTVCCQNRRLTRLTVPGNLLILCLLNRIF